MNPPPQKERRLPGWLVLLGALFAITPLSIDMYLPSFPSIAEDLLSDRGEVEITIAVFLAGLALGQLVYGPLSDRFGRKPPLYVGLLLYTVASAGCALASTLQELMFWRFIQAVGGSAGLVISFAVIRDRTQAQGTARALSAMVLVMGLAPILAPLIGGWILVWTNWRGIFWVLALFGAGCLLAVYATMQESLSPRSTAKISLAKVVGTYGRLLRHPQLMLFSLCGGLSMAGMFAYIAGSPYVLIELYGVPPQHYGWVFGLNAGGMIVASQINAHLVQRISAASLLGWALWILPLSSLFLLALVLMHALTVTLLILGLFAFIGSLGMINPNAAAIALSEQGDKAGAASALIGTLQFVIGTLAGAGVSLWHAHSAVPMIGVMTICGTVACLLFQFSARRYAPVSARQK